MNKLPKIYVGVDVSKETLDVAFDVHEKYFRVSNDAKGIKQIIDAFKSYAVEAVVCEASGGYEAGMIKQLRCAGYKVLQVDPKLIRHFILSKRIKAKTDKIDAHMIALYAAANAAEHQQYVRTEEEERLRDLIRCRQKLVEYAACEKKRLQQISSDVIREVTEKLIMYLEEQIARVEQLIKNAITKQSPLHEKAKLLQSIPGIGQAISTALVAEMPELGHISNKQVASLLGVAPRTHQSGRFEAAASIQGGRFMIRRMIYMAALSAIRTKGKFKIFYDRLRAKGKAAKICLVALMNKLICVANAVLRAGKTWDIFYA